MDFLSLPPFLIALLGVAVFFISLFKTNIALGILIFSMLLSPEFSAGAITGRQVILRAEDIFLIVIFLGWMARMAINKEIGLIKRTALNQPIIIYSAICLVATLLGAVQGTCNIKQGVFYLFKYLEYFVIFFMAVNNVEDLKQARVFIALLLLTCFFVDLYSWTHLGSMERLSAPFEGKGGEPNTLSGYLILMMALIMGFILHSKSLGQRLLFIGFFIFTFVPFVLTLSRGGWIAFFPMFFTFVLLARKYRQYLVMVLVAIALIMPYVAPDRVRARIAETFAPEKSYVVFGKKMGLSESAAARVDSWKVGFELWAKRPVLGHGIPSGVVVDNQYTRVLSETGLLGILAFFWIVYCLFSLGGEVYKNTKGNDFSQAVSLGFLAGLAGLLAHSFSSATFILIRVMEPFWFLAAIVAVLPEIVNQETPA